MVDSDYDGPTEDISEDLPIRALPGRSLSTSHDEGIMKNPTMTDATAATAIVASNKNTLHDCIALGDYELVASGASDQERERLPILLRILSGARPLSSIPVVTFTDQQETDNDLDVLLETAVQRLEDCAATYTAAEGLEVVACHLAPAICRKVIKGNNYKNKLHKQTAAILVKDTRPVKKRQKGMPANEPDSSSISSADELSDHETTTDQAELSSNNLQAAFAAEGEEVSQEAIVTKTLNSLMQLVATTKRTTTATDEHYHQQLSSDSILAQPLTSATAMDVASTVAALMEYTPTVLKHASVATALCRSAVPHASVVIARMGANCPAAIPCLVRGCLDSTSQTAVRELARLSARESSRIRSVLRRERRFPQLQLELVLDANPLEAACLLVEHLRHEQNESATVKATTGTDLSDDISCARTFRDCLQENSALLDKTITVVCAFLKEKRATCSIWDGGVCMALTALSLIFFRVGTIRLGDKTEAILNQCFKELNAWAVKVVEYVATRSNNELSCTSCLDRSFSLLLCAAITAFAATFEGAAVDYSGREAAEQCVHDLFKCRRISHTTNALVTRMINSFRRATTNVIEQVLMKENFPHRTRRGGVVQEHYLNAFERIVAVDMLESNACLEAGLKNEGFLADPRIGLELIENINATEDYSRLPIVKGFLELVLQDSTYSKTFLRSDIIPLFLEEAASMQLGDGPRLPFVLPIHIEKLSMKLSFHGSDILTDEESLFLLCLFYCICFAEVSDFVTTPFVFDARLLPLKHVRVLCLRLSTSTISLALQQKLMCYMDRHCTEIAARGDLVSIKQSMLRASDRIQKPVTSKSCKKALYHRIRKSAEDPESDPSGADAERTFAWANSKLDEASLLTTAVSALFSRSKSSPSFFTYSALCRDPLILLKCPLSIWSRTGMQRICLYMLSVLMAANECITKQIAANDETKEELLGSRNEIFTRSLLCLVDLPSNVMAKPRSFCSAHAALLRKVIAKNRGLLAMLLKQGLSESVVDWLIQWVPETMEDSSALLGILSDNSSMSTAERLVAAECILRIAVAHGHRYPDEAKILVYASLSQLVSSFFLIVGPVGVSVSTLVGDGKGLDATQVCRKAAFRMLNAIVRVNSYRGPIRSECFLALQKLAGLCKAENVMNSLPSSIANRQKALMKELMDAIVRACNAMGCVLQSI